MTMKALRSSMKGEKAKSKVQHISLTPKSAIAIIPPKKVIKALYDHEADPQHPDELSFSRGDFFHVISREDDPNWYEACNPTVPNARGLVPVAFFQVLGRTERDSAGSTASGASNRLPDHDSGYSDRAADGENAKEPEPAVRQMRISRSIGKGSGAMVYGIVQYDFAAERPDELEAKAGEAIIVIAQSNPEWFVAKPIGRLGGPGLIPVSFIEIRDMSTGQAVPNAQEAVARAGVPKVEEWKKMAKDYKDSSITLGKIDQPNTQSLQQGMGRMSISDGDQGYQNHNGNGNGNGYAQARTRSQHPQTASQILPSNGNPYSRPSSSRLLAPVAASIPRFCFANDKYWYIIEAVLEDGRHWELARFYQDFYDFQIALLQEFEDEAGNRGKPRTLPFMPGPVTYVTDAISNGRRQNLDEYIKKLLAMPPYISQCHLVRQLFAPREGDYEMDPNAVGEDYRLSGASQQSSNRDSQGASRQSSRGNLNGNGHHPSASATPPINSHQRGQPSLSNGVAQSVQYRNTSDLQPPAIMRQNSSLTQNSNGSQGTSNPSTSALKIKIFYLEECLLIRVPSDIGFQQLKDKIQARLSLGNDLQLQYKDEPTGGLYELLSDNDLDIALQRNSKLTVYVNYP
ncbi:MAG: bud emergence protein 1 [Pycnora praestabilis]|nr:MAG: bud emergence protein 1 [Pycnora praestabilis]